MITPLTFVQVDATRLKSAGLSPFVLTGGDDARIH